MREVKPAKHTFICKKPMLRKARCQKLEKQCVFFEIPKDPVSEYDYTLP